MKRVARLVGCTEGQAYTLVLAAALAVLLLAVTIPATSRGRTAATLAGAPVAVPPFRAPSDPEPAAASAPAAPPAAGLADPARSPLGPVATASPPVRTNPFPPPDAGARAGGGAGAGVAPGPPSPAPSFMPSPSPTPPSAAPLAPSDTATPAPLRIVESGWATAGAGTPAARLGVPAGTLPVATDAAGGTTRRSYIRLAGDASVLVLAVRRDGGATFGDETAAVAACAITDETWRPGEAQRLDEAPAFDAGRCAGGVRREDGSWSFDLAGLTVAERTGRAGLTLVADPAVPRGPFQLAFDPAAPGATP